MKLWKNALSVGLSLVLCVGMVTPSFAAVEYDVALGGVNVAKNDEGQTISWSEGHETYKDKTSAAVDNEIVVKQSGAETATQNTINVTGAAEGATIILSGVNIDARDDGKAAMSISGADTNVTVELDGENTLVSGGGHGGLELNKGASVTLQDETKENENGERVAVTEDDKAGSLDATGGINGAGIGAASRGYFGDIVIESGTIRATATPGGTINSGAAIGAGQDTREGNCGSIKIHGGTVTADASKANRGVGIGGGYAGGPTSTITGVEITGGNVTAIGSSYGIGPGEYGAITGSITITGGTVTAIGRNGGVASSTGGTIIRNDGDLELMAFADQYHNAVSQSCNIQGQGVLNGSIAGINGKTAFVIVNEDGEVVREFDLDQGIGLWAWGSQGSSIYSRFAVSLPAGTYYILQKAENGTYLQQANGKVAFEIGEGLTSASVKPASNKVKYRFVSGTEERELPEEVMKQLPTSYESDFTEVKDEDGTWTFQGWNIGAPQIVDGKLQDADAVGTWVYTVNPPAPVTPGTPADTTPTGPNVFEGYDFGTGTTEIEDEAVPLAAGPVTRAEFIDYLWRHEGRPESDGVCTFTDVEADHEYILALAWAEQNGIIEANEDGTFEPDELVTVAAVRDILDNFARVFEMDVDVYALASLTGEDDEAVLNCDEVIAEFFGEETEEQEAA